MSSSEIGGFVPFNERHSIVSCTASLFFEPQQVFIPDFQREVRKATKSLELPIAAPSFGVNISFDAAKIFLGVNRPADANVPPTGVEFSRSDDDGRLTWRHQAFPNLMVVQTFDYVRWKPFSSDANRFIRSISHMYPLDQLASVRLEYIDRFACKWDSAPPTAWRVVKSDSRYMNPSIHEGANLWHSHVGERFPISDGGLSRQRDVKIETVDDLLPDGSKSRNITVLTAVQDFVPTHFALGKDILQWVVETLDSQHDGLKVMLSEIFNEDACHRISLHEA